MDFLPASAESPAVRLWRGCVHREDGRMRLDRLEATGYDGSKSTYCPVSVPPAPCDWPRAGSAALPALRALPWSGITPLKSARSPEHTGRQRSVEVLQFAPRPEATGCRGVCPGASRHWPYLPDSLAPPRSASCPTRPHSSSRCPPCPPRRPDGIRSSGLCRDRQSTSSVTPQHSMHGLRGEVRAWCPGRGPEGPPPYVDASRTDLARDNRRGSFGAIASVVLAAAVFVCVRGRHGGLDERWRHLTCDPVLLRYRRPPGPGRSVPGGAARGRMGGSPAVNDPRTPAGA